MNLTTKLSRFCGGLSFANFVSAGIVLLTGITLLQPPSVAAQENAGDEAAAMQARQMWFFNQRAYPLGYIPAGAQQSALAQIKALTPTNPATPFIPWSNIGPAPITAGQISPPGPVSGRVTTIAVNPTNAQHWLVGGAQGGVWETRDGGLTWAPKTDDQASLAMGAIAFSQTNPAVIYAGTGEPNWSGDSYGGAGLLKSTNGGASWFLLASNLFDGKSFGSIIVHPTNDNVLLAAINVGIAGRGVETPTVTSGYGIYRSVNGGSTWTLRVSGYANDLQADPSNFNHQFATLTDTNTFVSSLRRSLNGGLSFSTMSGPWDDAQPFRIQVAISPSQPSTAYVSVCDGFYGDFGALLGVWRTDDAWSQNPTWTELAPPVSFEGQMWYDNVITVDPTSPDTVYYGGIGVWQYTGSDWNLIGGDYDDNTQGINFHPDQHALTWAGNRLIIGNDGGVWSTDDGGVTFKNHNSNLSINQFYYGSVHPGGASMALAGSQDNGTPLWTGSQSWPLVGEGDGAENAFSPNQPDQNWALSIDQLFIQRTKDGGKTLDDVFYGYFFNPDAEVPFIGRLVMSPTNENIVLTGDTALIKTTNFMTMPDIEDPSWPGDFWFYDSPDYGATITAIAFAPSDKKGRTYAWGNSDGQLHLTKTGSGYEGINIDAGGAVPGRYISSLAFDPSNPNVLYVALSGFNEGTPGHAGHLFKTTNALSSSPTWANVSPNVNIPFNAVAVDPKNSSIVYIGSDIGVFQSTNGAASWNHQGPEMLFPNVAVFDMKVQPKTGRVFAFTHGRGTLMFDTNVADLVLSSTNGPAPATLNTPYVFDYTISNAGPARVTNASVTVNFSSAVGIASVSTSAGTFSSTATNVTCTLGALATNGTARVTITITPAAIGWLTNSAALTSEALDPQPFNNSITAIVPVNPADMAIGKTAPTKVFVGYPMSYTISVTNFGPLPASGVTVVDTLPENVTFLNATTSQGDFTSDTGTVTFNVGALDVNYVATMTISVMSPDVPGPIANVAVARANEPDTNLANNQTTVVTDVLPLPPPIYNVSAIGFPTAAIITWNTLSNGTAQVAYGTTPSYGLLSSYNPLLGMNHSVLLTGLNPDTLYYFQVSSVVSGIVYTATGTFTTTTTLIMEEPDGAYFGDWTLSSALPDKYGSSYQYTASSADAFAPDATATFNATLPAPGNYDVSIWYPSSGANSGNVPVLVTSAAGFSQTTVNEADGGRWVPLVSNFNFPDGGGSVQIQNNTGEPNKTVIANAAKFSYALGQDKVSDGSIPAWWSQYFFGTNGVSASGDDDGDGYSNYTEYVLGTAPNDASSQLSFSVQSKTNGVTITFAPYQGGRVYQLQYRADFNSPWVTLGNTPSADANGYGTFTVTGLTGYYRLQARIAP